MKERETYVFVSYFEELSIEKKNAHGPNLLYTRTKVVDAEVVRGNEGAFSLFSCALSDVFSMSCGNC